MIQDLVSPWLAATEATNSSAAHAAHRERQAVPLEQLRRARTPLRDALPLCTDRDKLRPLARRAADPALHQQLRETLSRAAELGATECHGALLFAGEDPGRAAELVPWPDRMVALFLDQANDDASLLMAFTAAIAMLTRWSASDSQMPLLANCGNEWDPWQAAGTVPLREWIYAEGVGLHLAHALFPGREPHELMGITAANFARLRQRERVFRELLSAELDQSGIALVMRWIVPNAPASARTAGDLTLPPMTGHYLAWKMVERRVARIGIGAAIRAES